MKEIKLPKKDITVVIKFNIFIDKITLRESLPTNFKVGKHKMGVRGRSQIAKQTHRITISETTVKKERVGDHL